MFNQKLDGPSLGGKGRTKIESEATHSTLTLTPKGMQHPECAN